MKTPLFHLQYELSAPHTEPGSDRGAKLAALAEADPEVGPVLDAVLHMGYKETLMWLRGDNPARGLCLVVPLTTHTPEALRYRLEGQQPRLLFVSRPLHTIQMLDEFLGVANEQLATGAYLWCHSMTAVLKRKLIQQRYPWGVAHMVVAAQYLWHRVCPKLRLTRKPYFAATGGKDRTFNRVEIIGRLYRAGFEVVDEGFRDGEFCVVARKSGPAVADTPPTGSPIIHLRRVGKGGKEIVVHKLRTMYTYSEYVQPYIYHYQHLERGGKFKDDYRINFWGRLLRRTWLDELPMVWNLLRGDLKLVGVRPLSHHYFSLYSPDLQALRIRTKPGLLPPFYYEARTPETLDEVQASERRYLEAYLRHPLATDWRYLWGILRNILLRRRRSR